MEVKQNPFSVYDFFGYFTPGAIFIFFFFWVFDLSFVDISNGFGLTKAEAYVPFILFSYSIGHVVNFLSSVTIEKYALWTMGYPSKSLLGVDRNGYFHFDDNKVLRATIRVFIFIIILPVSFIDFVLGYVFKFRNLYAKPLDPLLIRVIKNKIELVITTKGGVCDLSNFGNAETTNFFNYAYHYAVEHAPNHLPKMQNYVALYGFLRSLCALSVIAFWMLVFHDNGICVGDFSLTLFLLSVFSYFLFMAFVKFYRRFSLEAMMAVSVVT